MFCAPNALLLQTYFHLFLDKKQPSEQIKSKPLPPSLKDNFYIDWTLGPSSSSAIPGISRSENSSPAVRSLGE